MDFQKKILQDQRKTILQQFQEVTLKWQQTKTRMNENMQATEQAFAEKDVEACKLPKERFFLSRAD